MVILGLLLLLIAVLIVIAAVAHGGDPASLDLQLFTVKTSVTGVFVAGAITLLLGVLGLAMVLWGVRRDRRRRGEIKELRNRASRRDKGAPQPGVAVPASPRPEASAAGSSTTGSNQDAPTRGVPGRPSGSGSTDSSAGGASTPGGPMRRDGPDEYFDSAPRDSKG